MRLDAAEHDAYELGRIIDSGVRPRIQQHERDPSTRLARRASTRRWVYPPPVPAILETHAQSLANTKAMPGEISPDRGWRTELKVHWDYVFGASSSFAECMKGVQNYLAHASGRRELVSWLFRLATSPMPLEVATTGFAVTEPRTGAAESAPHFHTKEECGKVGLRFAESGNRLTISNARGEGADFSRHPKAYRLVRYLASQRGEKEGRSRMCTTQEIFGAVWGGSTELIPKKNVPPHVSFARTLLKPIGWCISYAQRDAGYELFERVGTEK